MKASDYFHKYDFRNGKRFPKREITKRRQQVLDKMVNGQDFALIASGSSIIIGYKMDDGITIVEVTDGYVHYQYEVKEK